MDWSEYIKAGAAYAATAGLSALASRYHLTPDQTTAIMCDLAALGTAGLGILAHRSAALMQPPKEK